MFFGQLQSAATMWQPLVDSGCRTGVEMRAAWQELQHTGLQACAYLDRGLMGTLATPVEAMGSGAQTRFSETEAVLSCRSVSPAHHV